MVGGGGLSLGKKMKNEVREKMKEGKEKRRKITEKTGEKAIKMHLFGS